MTERLMECPMACEENIYFSKIKSLDAGGWGRCPQPPEARGSGDGARSVL